MRYPAAEKTEIIRFVEQSHLSSRQTLDRIGVSRSTFYRWHDLYQTGGTEALEDKPSRPSRAWSRILQHIHDQIIELALEDCELSPRGLAVRFTEAKRKYASEASFTYRLLEAHDLIINPAFIVRKTAKTFKDKTMAPNEMWQAYFTYFKIIGWGWVYLSTILGDFSLYVIAWKLCTTMKAQDVTDTLELGPVDKKGFSNQPDFDSRIPLGGRMPWVEGICRIRNGR